jgi:predicted nucleotidyltransferase
LHRLRAEAPSLRQRGVLHVALFGSAARGEADGDSDIDLAVTLAPDRRIGLIALAGLQRQLSALLQRPVDIVTLPVQRDSLRAAIEREAIGAF